MTLSTEAEEELETGDVPPETIEFCRLTDVPLSAIATLLNEARNTRHMPLSTIFTERSAAEWVQGKDEQWQKYGYGPWAVMVNGEFAGWGGFQHPQIGADY
jgi:hypothetical protein